VTSVRRSARIAEGWLPGRLLLEDFKKKMRLLRDEEEKHGSDISVGFVPLVSVDETTEAAEDRLNFPLLIQDVNKYTNRGYTDKEEIRGYFIAGTATECAEQLQGYIDNGMDYVIFDYRHSFDDIGLQMELTADEIIPLLR
jgi:alkanesulfonate monooxygenase SsuD/methylene tetrahydromethanopterin reductase-like flavin-dependent oxidoreductase (luciferase family)